MGPGHAALIIGHENKFDHITLSPTADKVWQDVSEFEKKMVVIDDNRPPYQIGTFENLIRYNKNYRVKDYLVSLPKLTNLSARNAFFLTKQIFDDPHIGLKKFGEKWLTRLFLTGSHSFKRFLLRKSGIQEDLKKYEETYNSVQRFFLACAKNDEEERKRQTEIMKDASRIVIL